VLLCEIHESWALAPGVVMTSVQVGVSGVGLCLALGALYSDRTLLYGNVC
jgi:hypothetical protein